MAFSHTRWSNNRSVMPLDVRGRTRATLKDTACVHPGPRGLGNPLNVFRARDWSKNITPTPPPPKHQNLKCFVF